MSYVGFWRRALAVTLDNLVWLIGITLILGFLPTDANGDPDISDAAAAAILFVCATAWFNYFSIAEWRWGQTIGKNATGIEVRSLDGSLEGGKVTFGQASLRNLIRIVDFFAVGPILMRGSERKQRLGDIAAKTVVVRRAEKTAPASTAAAAAASPPATPPATPPPSPAGPSPSFEWVTWRPSDVLVGVIAAALISSVGALILVAPWDPELDSAGAQLVAQLVLWGTLIGVALGAATGWRFKDVRAAWPRLGFRGITWSQAGLAALVVLVYLISAGILAVLLEELFGFAPEQEELSETLDVDLTTGVVIALYLSTCLIAPLTEETFFRGFLFGGLRGRWPFWAAAGVSALVFGLVHAGTGVSAIPFLVLLGLSFAWLYERTGSILPCMVAHALNNLLAITFQVTT